MNNFDERKKAFEAKFIQDEELNFKLRARRNKLVGEWAADQINKSGDENYIKAVRESDLEKPGDDDIIDKIFKDFQNLNLNITREDVIKKLQELETEVKSQLFNESDT